MGQLGGVEHNDNVEWLREIETELSRVNKQDDVKINTFPK